MQKSAIITLQQALKLNANYVDGVLNTQTLAACTQWLQSNGAADTGVNWQSWPPQRQAVLCLQLCCQQAGVNPGVADGWWGPQTAFAAEQLAALQQGSQVANWRDSFSTPANPHLWPLDRETELRAFYGEPGSGLIKIKLPYPLRLAWDTNTTVLSTQCHQKVAASLQKVLEQVLQYYGFDAVQQLRLDLYGGGFNLRAKRGGSSLSTHSWGIAFDFDPEHNQLKWDSSKASFARAEYDYWWQCWENEGWVSLGRGRNYDWMHVQAARL
ncbi:M15 family peptidase [Rheinheimera maricola]|uniref:M15 family peptidase n=1 Tax=Rheinheimera maricola TaxID=2793282 RepID=A0ABS7XCQ5_9GAMM|nr:M15 family peptidase [Rheinheimera maricola]MBZ9612508.1 M15 family peptidase [Rheinheimera maricola]